MTCFKRTFEHVALLMNGLSVLIGFRGFQLHRFFADRARWKVRPDSAWNPSNKSRNVWHGAASDVNQQSAQETVARLGTAEGCVRDFLKSSTGLDNYKRQECVEETCRWRGQCLETTGVSASFARCSPPDYAVV